MALIIFALLAGCTYEATGDEPQPPAEGAASNVVPTRKVPSKNSGVSGVEVRNYTEVEKRLAETPGKVQLSASGPANGPSIGFHEDAMIQSAGPYTVTMACAGIPYAEITLSQQAVGGKRDTIFEIDCSVTLVKIVQLQAGPVGARLIRLDPAGPWTGAVAGIRLTAP